MNTVRIDPHDELDELLEEAGAKSPADEFLDELMPPEFEWRTVVRRHPIPAVLVAAGLGYWLGRSRRGAAVAEALAGAAALTMTSRLGATGIGSPGSAPASDTPPDLD